MPRPPAVPGPAGELSAFAELGFGGRRGRGTRRRLLAGGFLLAVPGAELPGDQDRGDQGDAVDWRPGVAVT